MMNKLNSKYLIPTLAGAAIVIVAASLRHAAYTRTPTHPSHGQSGASAGHQKIAENPITPANLGSANSGSDVELSSLNSMSDPKSAHSANPQSADPQLPTVNPDVPISPAVATAIGRNAASPQQQLAASAKLPAKLSPNDTAALLQFMNLPSSETPIDPLFINAVKNNIFNYFLELPCLPDNFGLLIACMARNPAHDPIWRAYCTQFIGEIWPKNTDDSAKPLMLAAITNAIANTSSPAAATALIALSHISAADPDYVSMDFLARQSIAIAVDPAAAPAGRATALQVAARAQAPGTLAVARSIAFNKSNDITLRISAIAAIGLLGSRDDAPNLKNLLANDSPRLIPAINAAIKRISAKNHANQNLVTVTTIHKQ